MSEFSFPFLEDEVEACLLLLTQVQGPRRVLVGVAGPPGVGKSTVTEALVRAIDRRLGHDAAAAAPMDGCHLLNERLLELGLRDRKGAPETFDVEAYAALLRRIRDGEAPLPVPTYSRVLSRPVPGGIVLKSRHRIVVAEGNYLYLETGAWAALNLLFDRRIFLSADREECRRRLLPRHVASGKTPEHAARHVETVDLDNYDRIYAALDRRKAVIYENQ